MATPHPAVILQHGLRLQLLVPLPRALGPVQRAGSELIGRQHGPLRQQAPDLAEQGFLGLEERAGGAAEVDEGLAQEVGPQTREDEGEGHVVHVDGAFVFGAEEGWGGDLMDGGVEADGGVEYYGGGVEGRGRGLLLKLELLLLLLLMLFELELLSLTLLELELLSLMLLELELLLLLLSLTLLLLSMLLSLLLFRDVWRGKESGVRVVSLGHNQKREVVESLVKELGSCERSERIVSWMNDMEMFCVGRTSGAMYGKAKNGVVVIRCGQRIKMLMSWTNIGLQEIDGKQTLYELWNLLVDSLTRQWRRVNVEVTLFFGDHGVIHFDLWACFFHALDRDWGFDTVNASFITM